MIASEDVRHVLSFALRVDDAFADVPIAEELAVSLDTGEVPLNAPDHDGPRQADGTYRFIDLAPGPRQLTILSPSGDGFTWTATTPVAIPIADPRQAVVVSMWPTPQARTPLGVIAIRGVLVTAAAGTEVHIDPVATPPPPGKKTRCDAAGEFVFVVAGWTEIDKPTGMVELTATVPAHTVTSVDVLDGTTVTTYASPTFFVPPGRDTRVRIHLT
jgi:hypothetical protein